MKVMEKNIRKATWIEVGPRKKGQAWCGIPVKWKERKKYEAEGLKNYGGTIKRAKERKGT